MSVVDTGGDPPPGTPVEPLTPEETIKRIRQIAWAQPDLNFCIVEELMDHLGITKEKQHEIIVEGVRKWQL